jgi:hypothetical protein
MLASAILEPLSDLEDTLRVRKQGALPKVPEGERAVGVNRRTCNRSMIHQLRIYEIFELTACCINYYTICSRLGPN